MNISIFLNFISSIKIHFGGKVLSKIPVTLAVFLISFSGSAATKGNSKSNALAKKINDRQSELKQDYLNSKQIFYKSTLPNMDVPKSLKNCERDSNIECQAQTFARTASFKYKRSVFTTTSAWASIKQWLLSMWTGLKSSYSRMARATKINKNDLPVAGGDIAYYSTSSGVNARYVFYTLDEMNDPDGEVKYVTWNFDDGSSMDIPRNELNNYATMAHVFPEAGTYDVTLRIYDNEGDFTELSETVTVTNNLIPSPNITAIPDTGNIVDFAVAANDPENSISQYTWNFGDGSAEESGPTLDTVNHEFPTSGEYEVAVKVTDSAGAVAEQRKLVYVDTSTPGTAKPYPIVKMSTIFGEGPLTVNFDAGLSVDQLNAAVEEYDWNFGDFDSIDNLSTIANPTHIFTRPGTYYGRLTIKDASDNTADHYFQVFVHAENIEPVIIAQKPDNTKLVKFNSAVPSSFIAADGSSHIWEFGDNKHGTGNNPQHTYALDGFYPVRLVVHGLTGTRHVVGQTINVTDAPSALPQVDVAASETYQTKEVEYDYAVINAAPASPNDQLTYTWYFADGAFIQGSEYAEVSHTFDSKGLHSIYLVATNSDGYSSVVNSYAIIQEGSVLRSVLKPTPKVGVAPLAVTMSHEGSTTSSTDIVKFVWFTDSVYKEFETTSSHTFTTPGHYKIGLLSKDDLGNLDIVFKKIVAYNPGDEPSNNAPPKAQFITRFDSADPHDLTLDASTSTDDEEIMAYYWKVDGTDVGESKVFVKTLTEGAHTIQLTVVDGWNRKSVTSKKVKIGASVTPFLAIEKSSNFPAANELITFSAPETTVPGADIQNYTWDFGDGTPITSGETVQHTYAANGSYTVILTIVDTNGVKHKQVLTITVDDPENPTAVLSITDLSETDIIGNGGTFIGLHYPTTFKFSALESTGQRPIVDAIWDFGDGNMAYGLTPEFTVFKPGSHEITVTVFDTLGKSSSQAASIILDSETDCISEIDDTMCMRLETSDQNVLKFSESEWRFANSLELDFATSPTGPWVKLLYIDEINETSTEVDVSDIITIDGEDLLLSKSGIVAKNIDLSRPYQLVVETEAATSEIMSGRSQVFYFGSASITFKAQQENVDLVIKHGTSDFKKYIRMGSALDVTVDNLPSGSISISAVSGTQNFLEELKSTGSKGVVKIDFNRKKTSSSKNMKRLPDGRLDLSELGPSFWNPLVSSSGSNNKTGYLPEFKGCSGENPPMPPNPNPFFGLFDVPSDWVERGRVSTSFTPEISFTRLPEGSSRKLKMVCYNSSDSHNYAWYKWLTGNVKSCGDNLDPWMAGVNAAMPRKESEAIEIVYQIKDSKTGAIVGDSISTNPRTFRAEMGYTAKNMAYQVGVPAHVAHIVREYDVPSYFEKPEFKLKVNAPDYIGLDIGFAATDCILYSKNEELEIKMTAPLSSLRSATRAEINANNSANSTLGFFPVQEDISLDGVQVNEPDIVSAKYKFWIREKGSEQITWEKLKLTWNLTGHSPVTKLITIEDEETTYNPATGDRYTIATATISPEMFNPSGSPSGATSVFNYKRSAAGILTLDFEAIGTGGHPVVKGEPRTFKPLYNARTVANNKDESGTLDEKVCTGIYGANLSLYATWGLITKMKQIVALGTPLVCNDMSLPFGGEFRVNGALAHEGQGHKIGEAADVRYFNSLESFANDYDKFNSSGFQGRELDVFEYIEFSRAAYHISKAQDHYSSVMGSTPAALVFNAASASTRRTNLFDFCYSGVLTPAPCSTKGTTPTHDYNLTHAQILDICQRFEYLADCPFRTTLGKDTLQRLKRLSGWLKEYQVNLQVSLFNKDIFYYISSGKRIARNSELKIPVSYNWQAEMIEKGMWPNVEGLQEFIRNYDVGTDTLIDEPVVPCYGTFDCGIHFTGSDTKGIIRDGGSNHYDHQHLQLME